MEATLQVGGAPGGKRRHRNNHGDCQHHDIGCLKPQFHGPAGEEADAQNGRNRQADGGESRSQANVDRALNIVLGRGVNCGKPLGRQYDNCDQDSSERRWQTGVRDP